MRREKNLGMSVSLTDYHQVGRKALAAMPTAKRLAGLIPEMNLINPSCVGTYK